MKEQLSGLFGLYSEAVIAVLGNEIAYSNAAAQRLLPAIGQMKPDDLLPAAALEQESDSFVGEADIAGKRATYSAARLGEYRIFSILSPDDDGETVSTVAFSAMSMEMKDYLTALQTAAGVILPYVESTGDERLGRYAAMMNKCYHNILRLTTNMEVLGFGQGGPGLVRGCFDLISVCAETIESAAQLADGLGVSLSFNSALDSLDIYADKDKLVQMLLNMISNSLIHAGEGGTAILTVSQSGNNALIKLTDRGGGMTDSVKPTAWSRYGEPKTLTGAKSGAGFGLAAVSRIARLHGGNVLLDSRENEGTTIAASIPLGLEASIGLKTDVTYYRSCGSSPLLTGLSTVISYDKFTQKYMD